MTAVFRRLVERSDLRVRILGGYGLVLCLVVLVFAWALVDLSRLGRASDAILRENYKSILAADSMIDSIARQDSAALLLLLGHGDEGARKLRESESAFLQWLGRAKDNFTVPGEAGIVGDIDKRYTEYLVRVARLEAALGGEPGRAATLYREEILPAFRAVHEACIRLREINEAAMVEASERARRVGRTSTSSLLVVGLAAIGLGLGFSLFLSSILVRPLRLLMKATQAVARGEYGVRVPEDTPDELGRLGREFNAMVRRLQEYRDLNLGEILAEKRKHEAVLESIDEGIVVVSPSLQIESLNPKAAQVLGSSAEGAVGRHMLEVVRSERLFTLVKATAETGEAPALEEGDDILIVGEAERRRYYQFSTLPLRPKSGTLLGVALVLRDVTRLKELDRLKSEFVMKASHELRTPLTSIGMSLGLLEKGIGPQLKEQEAELLGVAREDVERLKALVNDLLDLSRIEAGKMEVEVAPTQAGVLIERVVSTLLPQAEDKGISFETQLPDGLPEVLADQTRIVWVLINLISNALRHTARGGNIRVAAERVGGHVHFSVTDDGEGIPYEYQARIFDKFVQVKKGASGGTGLGLAICREIVRAHGGSIWVESEPGKGSTFTFALPAAGEPERTVRAASAGTVRTE